MAKKKGRRKVRVWSVLLTGCLLLTLFCCGKQLIKLQDLRTKQLYYQEVYQDLLRENTELLATRDLLNDDSYMERLARQRFKLIRPNEYLVVPAETNEQLEKKVNVDTSDLH